MEPIIRSIDVCREFRSGEEIIHALRNVSISVMPGTLNIIKGRSGSGKTTLMNILGALDKPSSGEVFFKDINITALSDAKSDSLRRNDFAFIFQSVALLPNMNAFENVEFALRLAGVNERDQRVLECLEYVGLAPRKHHMPMELSGGEQQRVAIARAIAHHPKVVFADEPTGELDVKTGLRVMKIFRELVDQEGLTIIMSTHDPNMMELGDHVFTIEDGSIIDEQFNAREASA